MREIKRAVLVFAVFSIILGIAYPLGFSAIIKVLFPRQSGGSLMIRGNHVVGSELIGQRFVGLQYFHGRPSATDPAYNASGSGASNFGPTNRKFIEQVSQRMDQVRKENGLHSAEPIPADLVLASASGLDPHITVESAMLQVPRVARVRRLPGSRIENLVRQHSEEPLLGIWGKRRVNVLMLNVALDEIQR